MHLKALAAFAVAGTSLSYATYSRVESMGKHDTYFMDDISVWTNPANINIYPNYLMGDLGRMVSSGKPAPGEMDALARYNKDPSSPWFGAVFAKSLGDEKSPNRYPQIAIGGAFNRDDEMLKYLDAGNRFKITTDSLPLKMDGMLGFTASNGIMLGVKGYGAGNSVDQDGVLKSSWFTRFILGANIPLAQGADLEVSGGITNFDYTHKVKDVDSLAVAGLKSDIGFDGRVRAFFSIPAISGEVVPAASFMSIKPLGREITDVKAGCGVNVSLDRGFFWIGADYIHHNEVNKLALDSKVGNYELTGNGARVSFGIERNIWTDWLVLRVGGQKYMMSNENKTEKGGVRSDWSTNPIGDGTENDHVGFGIGLNIEDKLKIDATMGEDLVFTGGNLLGGPVDHVFSRISATYSF
ncbi:MAG: hypothetical protein RL318_1103 [Fibrobacterota bacterium]